MRPVLAAQLKSRPGRLIATAIAVIVAVAFVVVTLSLGGAFTSTMRQAFGEVLKHADAEIECVDVGAGDADADPCAGVLERVRGVDGVAAAAAVASSALELRGEGERLHVQSFALIDPALRWQDLASGTWPEGDDEIALDADSAKQLAAGVGDRVEVAPIGSDDATDVELVGIFAAGKFSFPQAVVPADPQPWSPPPFAGDEQLIVKAEGGSDAALVERLTDADLAAGAQVDLAINTVDEAVEAELEKLTAGTGILTGAVTVFALIAIVVAGIVITLTFQVLVVQRTRELALLRCIGAAPGQVRRLVLAEAAVIGTVAAALGAGAGVALVLGVFPLLDLSPVASDALLPALAGLGIGVLLTLVCALGPARRATRVAPLAALRPADLAPVTSRRGAGRLVLGVLIAGAGGAGLALGIARGEILFAMPGGIVLFVGAIILFTFVVPSLLRLLTAGWARTRAPSEIAAANVARNPGRTAATAVALVVGIGLVTTVIAGKTSLEKSLGAELAERRPLDLVALSDEFTAGQVEQIAALDGVTGAVAVPAAPAQLGEGAGEEEPPVRVLAPGAAALALARDAVATPKPGEIAVPDGFLAEATTSVTFLGGEAPETTNLRVTTGRGPDYQTPWVNPADLPDGAATGAVLIRVADDVDSAQLNDIAGSIRGLGPDVQVDGGAFERVQFTSILTTVMLVVLGLLGAAIAISIIGVSNTLALTVLERKQESGLLRALGFTRGQMRLMLAVEAVLIALAAIVLGIALGLFEAWAGMRALAAELGVDLGLAVPWGWLALIVAVALAAALLASVLPARSAARTSPVAAMTQE